MKLKWRESNQIMTNLGTLMLTLGMMDDEEKERHANNDRNSHSCISVVGC